MVGVVGRGWPGSRRRGGGVDDGAGGGVAGGVAVCYGGEVVRLFDGEGAEDGSGAPRGLQVFADHVGECPSGAEVGVGGPEGGAGERGVVDGVGAGGHLAGHHPAPGALLGLGFPDPGAEEKKYGKKIFCFFRVADPKDDKYTLSIKRSFREVTYV